MKIKKITIGGYKNLAQEFPFEQAGNYIALIGLNGSGKSNLLEAISFMFGQAMGIEFPFQFPITRYRLTYDIRGHSVDIDNSKDLANGTVDSAYIPSSVIACYSGEDSRLWNSGFKEYYVKFFNDAIGGGEYKPQVLYVNKLCWKIAFISLLFSENDDVKGFISDKLKIDANSVTIHFNKKNGVNSQENDASNWYKRVEAKFGGANISIRDLKEDEDIALLCEKYSSLTDDQIVFYYLYCLYMPDKKGTLGLQADKLIESIDISLNGFSFDDLSEGEKKLILIECITKVLGDEDSLVLLDEPDAHTHIAMKKDLLKLISEFEGQTIMTTHSPMFLSKKWEGYKENNIFYMHDGIIENTEPLKHLAELTDNEVDYFKGTFILSSKKILVVEGKFDDKYLRKAIEIHSKSDPIYKKLNDIVMFSSNGSSEAEVVYEQSLKQSIDRIEKLVFLFDYDDGGWKDGWKKIKCLSETNDKIVPLFYQDNYPSMNYPTNDEDVKSANNHQKCIMKQNSFMVEDLFAKEAYYEVIKPVVNAKTHKDFNSLTIGKKGTVGAIKEFIEKEYDDFKDEWYNGFKPVLDKLLEVFELK